MKTRRLSAWALDAILVAGMAAGAATAVHGQQNKTTGCAAGGQEWLRLMDKDNDGTVSKLEFQNYMGAQFTKADTDHDGTLDAKELAQLRMTLSCKE